MFLTGRRLLEWETAAEASLRTKGATDLYLEWSPVLAAGITALLGCARPEALPAAAPLLLRGCRRAGRALAESAAARAESASLEAADVSFLREHALRTWSSSPPSARAGTTG